MIDSPKRHTIRMVKDTTHSWDIYMCNTLPSTHEQKTHKEEERVHSQWNLHHHRMTQHKQRSVHFYTFRFYESARAGIRKEPE